MNPLRFLTEGIWRDEAFSYLLARHSFIDIIRYTVEDFNPPLYYFILHIWMQLFGSSEISMRSLSLLFYVVGVFCTYELFKVILNKSHKHTVLYTILFALNPILFFYAFETRMYSMLFCLAMASTFYFFKRDWRNYVIIAVIGMYTHYFMGLVLLTQFLFYIVPDVRKKISLLKVWYLFKPYVLIGICFLPWAIFFLLNNSEASSQYWIVPLKPMEIVMLPGLTYSGIEKDFAADFAKTPYYQFIVLAFSVFFAICVAVGFKYIKKKTLEFDLFLYSFLLTVLPLAIILAVMLIKPLYVPRYLIFVSAGVSLTIIFAALGVKRNISFILLSILLIFTLQFHQIQLKYRDRDSTKNVIAKIKPLAESDDLVYVDTELDYMTAQYYYNDKDVRIYGKTYNEIPSYVGKVLIFPSAIATDFPIFPKKAFLITGPETYEIRSQFR